MLVQLKDLFHGANITVFWDSNLLVTLVDKMHR